MHDVHDVEEAERLLMRWLAISGRDKSTAETAADTSEVGTKPRLPELPDPALFWRWVGRATRPVWGWSLVGLGFIFVLVGYLGISREALVAKQLPYLISGGIGGIALVGFGAMLVGSTVARGHRKHRDLMTCSCQKG